MRIHNELGNNYVSRLFMPNRKNPSHCMLKVGGWRGEALINLHHYHVSLARHPPAFQVNDVASKPPCRERHPCVSDILALCIIALHFAVNAHQIVTKAILAATFKLIRLKTEKVWKKEMSDHLNIEYLRSKYLYCVMDKLDWLRYTRVWYKQHRWY